MERTLFLHSEKYLACWQITRACNFNCSNCISSDGYINNKNNYVKDIIKTLKETGKEWTVEICGGEPFMLPGFVKICEELTGAYNIAILTNLSL
ncbi:radical SAM protein [Elusimicrobiota bacterium]